MEIQNQEPVSSQPNMPIDNINVNTPKSKSTIWVSIAVLIVIILAGGGYYFYHLNNNKNIDANQALNNQNLDQNNLVNKDLPVVPISANTDANVNNNGISADQNAVINKDISKNPVDTNVAGMMNAIKNIKDIISKKDKQAFFDFQSIFYKKNSTVFADLQSTFTDKIAPFIWQTYGDIFSNFDLGVLAKDLANCKITGKRDGYTFDQLASCQTTLAVPKNSASMDPLADGSTNNLQIKFAEANGVWYVLAPQLSDFTPKS